MSLVAPRARLASLVLAWILMLSLMPFGAVSAAPGTSAPPATVELSPSTSTSLPPVSLAPDCTNDANPAARTAELLANGYRLGSAPLVTLPTDLAWTEDPLRDANWRFQLHSMRYVLDLMTTWRATSDPAPRERALELLRDWVEDNPRYGAPSADAWGDHSTALRAVVLACVADQVEPEPWLVAALVRHGLALADPAFYRQHGNHALNQAIGLLEVGRVLSRPDWVRLAADRINALVVESVDAEGVTNEQSISYQGYNYRRYLRAKDRLVAVGAIPSYAFARIDRMPDLLAWATLPSGRYEMIGDTLDSRAGPIPGTLAEFAASGGASGPRPPSAIRAFARGFLFVRSGWGERRAFADETALSTKWGAAPVFHGHADGGQVTLAAWGSRLLLDPGMYAYMGGAYRWYFKGRSAHNVVTVDGLTWSRTATTSLVRMTTTSKYVDIRTRNSGYAGVRQARRVTYSRGMDYLLVEDRASSSTTRTFRQLWHLHEGASPLVGTSTVVTRRARGNVLIRQLAGGPTLRVVTGATSPVQGWISYQYGRVVRAPVVQAVQRGTSVRYLTLIVPAAGRAAASVSGLRLTTGGYSMTITIGARSERITVSGDSVWVTPVQP